MLKQTFAAAMLLVASGVTSSSTGNPTMLGQPVFGSPIRHVIVMVQENRTFDNLFAASVLANGGPYPGADIARTAALDGEKIELQPIPFENPADPSHTHLSLMREWDNGRMDGFASDPFRSILPWYRPPENFEYAYVPASETAIYHLLAARYALADENFAPRLVPTFPSHYTLATAQSRVAGNPNDRIWGCDSKPGTVVPTFGAGESMLPTGVFPCFDQPTIGELLDAAHVTWKYYTGRYDARFDQAVNIYDAFRKIRYGRDWQRNVITPPGSIAGDIENCRLPQVSFVMPTALDSDHAGTLGSAGPGWVGSIYLAVVDSAHAAARCNYYKDSAIIVTWDDSGGWYDHVAPPPGPDGTTWGFRIPIIVMSAWARSTYDPADPKATPFVSHRRRESTAIVRFIEENWDLGNMGQRDATDDDLSDMFDYTRAAPVPAFSEMAMRRLIERTHFNLAVADRDTRPVDDDR